MNVRVFHVETAEKSVSMAEIFISVNVKAGTKHGLGYVSFLIVLPKVVSPID